MNAVIKKHFDKLSSSEFKCKVQTQQEDDGIKVEKTCDCIIVVGKESRAVEPQTPSDATT